MASTTRASTKRLRDKPGSHHDAKAVRKKVRTTNETISSTAAAETVHKRCRLLELPPELRNIIYGYTVEGLGASGLSCSHPLLMQWRYKTDPLPRLGEQRLRQYFGLTQACKQLRAEYRPLWIGNSKPRIQLWQLAEWLEAFFPAPHALEYGPAKLQISWGNRSCVEVHGVLEITPLLKMKAYNPAFECQSIPHYIANYKYPNWAQEGGLCRYCIGLDDVDDSDGGCICDEAKEMFAKDWEAECYKNIRYADPLHAVLNNKNEVWLTDLREDRIKVYCSLHREGVSDSDSDSDAEEVDNLQGDEKEDDLCRWAVRIDFVKGFLPHDLHYKSAKQGVQEYAASRGLLDIQRAIGCLKALLTFDFRFCTPEEWQDHEDNCANYAFMNEWGQTFAPARILLET